MRKAEDFIQMIEDRIPVHAHLGMTKERYLIGVTTACIEIIAEVLEEAEHDRAKMATDQRVACRPWRRYLGLK